MSAGAKALEAPRPQVYQPSWAGAHSRSSTLSTVGGPSMLGAICIQSSLYSDKRLRITTSQPGLDSSSARSLARVNDPKCTRAIRMVRHVSCTSEQKKRPGNTPTTTSSGTGCYIVIAARADPMMWAHGKIHAQQQMFADPERLISPGTITEIGSIACVLAGWGPMIFDPEHGPSSRVLKNARQVGAESVMAPPRLVIDSFALQIGA
jgi:hypothetical protein